MLVTTPDLRRRKVAAVRGQMPTLKHVILVGDGAAEGEDTLPRQCNYWNRRQARTHRHIQKPIEVVVVQKECAGLTYLPPARQVAPIGGR